MSETKMVTIEVPIEVAASFSTLEDATGHIGPLAQACKAALAARKTKLEVWRDGLFRYECRQGDVIEVETKHADTARLWSAAPLLLEALIHARNMIIGEYGSSATATDEAIIAALPADVAAEILDA